MPRIVSDFQFPPEAPALTPRQLDFLRVLADAKGPISRATWTRRVGCEAINTWHSLVGSLDPEKRAKNRHRYGNRRSLLDLGYVVSNPLIIEGEKTAVYRITDSGKKVLTERDADA